MLLGNALWKFYTKIKKRNKFLHQFNYEVLTKNCLELHIGIHPAKEKPNFKLEIQTIEIDTNFQGSMTLNEIDSIIASNLTQWIDVNLPNDSQERLNMLASIIRRAVFSRNYDLFSALEIARFNALRAEFEPTSELTLKDICSMTLMPTG